MSRTTAVSSRRLALLAGLVAALTVASTGETRAATPTGCVPIPDEAPRGSAGYRDPEPDAALKAAVARLKAVDPAASVRFSDCEVDSFATRAKDTVPTYALDILRAARLPFAPVKNEVYPPPTLEPKGAQDLDGSALLAHKLPLGEEDRKSVV